MPKITQSSSVIKWPISSHELKHVNMMNSLIDMLADFNDSMLEDDSFPKNNDGSIDFSKISIQFLFQWAHANCTKIIHEHSEGFINDE